jgi:dUTP pyrophosphatase
MRLYCCKNQFNYFVKITKAEIYPCLHLTFAPMQSVSVNIVNKSTNILPAYESVGAAGMDIRANLEEPVVLQPLDRSLIPTGLFIELPHGYEMQIRPRSGLAVKQGITCLNTPGTIDSDYRGEIKVILINLSNEIQTIHHGERIAQMILNKVEKADFKLVQKLSDTQRGEGGFGHTGKH